MTEMEGTRPAAVAALVAGGVVTVVLVTMVTGLLPRHHPIQLSLLAVSDLLLVVALVGLWRSRACGDGVAAKAGLGLAMLGLLLDAPGEILTEVSRAVAGTLSGGGTGLFALGMIVAGIAMLREGRWRRWRRFVPLALGLYVPVILVPALVSRVGTDLAFTVYGLGYVLLGIAMWPQRHIAA